MIAAVSPWWYITPPVVSAALGAAAVLYGLRRDRNQSQMSREQRERRWDRTADAVWGKVGNPELGEERVIGLRPLVENISTTVNDIKDEQESQGRAITEHAQRDENSFQLIGAILILLHPKAEELLKRREHEPDADDKPK